MDAIAWITQAMPLLSDHRIVQDTLDSYRTSEVPLESSLLVRYYTQKTSSTAILTAVSSLNRYCSDLSRSDTSPILLHLQAIELLIANNAQAQLCIRKKAYESRVIPTLYRILSVYEEDGHI